MRYTNYISTLIFLASGITSIGQGFAQSDPSPDASESMCYGAICFGTLGIVIIAALVIFAIIVIALLIYLLKKDKQ